MLPTCNHDDIIPHAGRCCFLYAYQAKRHDHHDSGWVQVVAAKMQQITVKEFLPLLGLDERSVRNYRPSSTSNAISIEWMIAYRFGHDLIPDQVSFQLHLQCHYSRQKGFASGTCGVAIACLRDESRALHPLLHGVSMHTVPERIVRQQNLFWMPDAA